jgi:magnesium transporter
VIVDIAAYTDGSRVDDPIALDTASEISQRDGTFVWLGVHEPSLDEFWAIAREFDLHELAVEDAINAHQQPKVELYGETMLIVVKTAFYVDEREAIDIGELLIFAHPSFVITVRHGECPLGEARRRLERRPDLLRLGAGAAVYAILDRVVDDYEVAAVGIDKDIQEVERQVFSNDRENVAERIYKLERETLTFHRAVAPFFVAISGLARGHYDIIPADLHEYIRDVHDHLQRVSGRIAGFRDLLSSALQANLTQVTVRQNSDMRKISAWVAIFAVPTMVAGIYGMNFEEMPELKWSFGYPLVLGVIALLCLALYLRFKRSGWL